ncbi:hypothetical protein [Parageobacillus thermoglucosidasius]|uniref:hypothetical protein n=1 Tax=Parageobacillus thermoglucosidasius TaxID=1426 RepID=UPI000443065B|nr:hypothetical protein [Parageobacillus thermoglucosidasius]BDG31753.1 hypothetical protein PthBH41_14650 [Parageobacillus thermoglucosidasius]GAJ42947.1 hypothetical protein GT2_05_01770 [Parageobacillus thermoglucosidasius NBRC 107763]
MNKKIVFSLAASLAIVGASFTAKAAETDPCPAAKSYEVKYILSIHLACRISKNGFN